jgi:hypothetical protein
MTNRIKLALGSGMGVITMVLGIASAHAQAVDAAFVTNVATTSIASLVTIWTSILPVLLPFAIAVAVLFAVIHFIRNRARPN